MRVYELDRDMRQKSTRIDVAYLMVLVAWLYWKIQRQEIICQIGAQGICLMGLRLAWSLPLVTEMIDIHRNLERYRSVVRAHRTKRDSLDALLFLVAHLMSRGTIGNRALWRRISLIAYAYGYSESERKFLHKIFFLLRPGVR